MLHSTDLSGDDFAIKDGKIVSKQGFAGPFELTEGTIADYENQSGKPELVWYGGTEAEPTCVWVVFPDGTNVKTKWPVPGEVGFCAKVVECLADDIALGEGTYDKYRIPEMTGPTWRVVTVVYGSEDTELDFSLDVGTDLASLIAALNDSDELPENWYWEILTGALTLCVPHDTNVTQVVLEGGLEVDFTEPTVEGTPASTLGGMVTVHSVVTGNGAAVGSVNDTEAEIEAQFALMQNVTVRWEDADGDQRVSYKDSVNGWYHPAEKYINPAEDLILFTWGTGGDYNFLDTTLFVSLESITSIPDDAKQILVILSGSTTLPSDGFAAAVARTPQIYIGDSFIQRELMVAAGIGYKNHTQGYVKLVQSGGNKGIRLRSDDLNPDDEIIVAELQVIGWKR